MMTHVRAELRLAHVGRKRREDAYVFARANSQIGQGAVTIGNRQFWRCARIRNVRAFGGGEESEGVQRRRGVAGRGVAVVEHELRLEV